LLSSEKIVHINAKTSDIPLVTAKAATTSTKGLFSSLTTGAKHITAAI